MAAAGAAAEAAKAAQAAAAAAGSLFGRFSVRVREINKLPVHYQSNTGNSCFSFILL